MQIAKYTGETLICTLKENSITVNERRDKISFLGAEVYNFNKAFSFQEIKSVEFKKDYLHYPDKNFDFVYSMAISFTSEKRKFVISDVELQVNYSVIKTFKCIKNDSYNHFVSAFVNILPFNPHIKIYAYEGTRGRILSKMSRFFPRLVIGSLVFSSPLIFKLLVIVFKISLQATLLFWLDNVFIHLGALLTIIFATVSYFMDKRVKNKSLIASSDLIPNHFLSSFTTDQNLLKL
jgi:hypothetical protein